jgi:hypothetical protein
MYSSVSGNIGIGTPTPELKLSLDTDGGIIAVGTYGTGDTLQTAGIGTRLIWYPRKAAFRAGAAESDEWDEGNIGDASVAMGIGTRSEGQASVALGRATSATESYSLAMGYQSDAQGVASAAIGNSVGALGAGSVAMGHSADARGDFSIALGHHISADSTGSVVLGSGMGSGQELINDIRNSLMVGFDDTVATLFVGGPAKRVGIGTETPAEKLDVAGTAQVQGFKMPTGAADYYVLTSDASGAGSWQPAANDSDWTISGDNIYSALPGSVGIGTASPTAKLDVAGKINADSAYQIGNETVLSIEGTYNLFAGVEAGANATGGQLTFVGARTGQNNQGSANTFLGAGAGEDNTTGYGNTIMGSTAGGSNTTGYLNTFLGQSAGSNNTEGNENVCLGNMAGYEITGNKNTFVGTFSGYNAQGDSNVFIGYRAGYLETGSNKFYIANGSDISDVLIYGDFSTGNVGLGILTPAERLDVAGTARVEGFEMPTGAADHYVLTSDATGTGSWQPAVLDSDWTISGNHMYAAVPGSVGIGTASPVAKLDVVGGINVDSVYMIGGDVVLSTIGIENISVGIGAGANDTGAYGTFVGYQAGYDNQGNGNTFLGRKAGRANTSGNNNTFVGNSAGLSNTEGVWNTFVGYDAGTNNTLGGSNTFIGRTAGYSNTEGITNTFVGRSAGYSNTTGGYNTFLGSTAGQSNTTGSENVFLGRDAGYSNTTGTGNVFIGYKAGYLMASSNKLAIANGSTSTDILIYGDFSTDRVGIGTVSPSTALEVDGTVTATAFVGDGSGLTGVVGDDLGDHTATQNIVLGSYWLSGDGDGEGIAVDNSGGVGIGTLSPVTKLDVAGDVNAQSKYLIGETSVLSIPSNENVLVGANAGLNNTGDHLTAVGDSAGYANQGDWNTFIGADAGRSNVGGNSNSFVGYRAGYSNTGGYYNTFVGLGAGQSNITGYANTFLGRHAGNTNTSGHRNTFLGNEAGYSNTTADENIFIGYRAGYDNTVGTENTFLGIGAGSDNIDADGNTFLGWQAGLYTTTGGANTFVGSSAGMLNTTGFRNTFLGEDAGHSNTTGVLNTCIGENAGYDNATGNSNTFLGTEAGFNHTTGDNNTFLGASSGYGNTDGAGNVFIGYQAGYNETGSGKLYIASGADTSQVLIYGDFSSGKVGLGTLSPSEKLHVGGDAEVDSNMYIAGNVGIGTGSPSEKLHIRGSAPVVLIDDQGGGNTHLQFDLSAFEDWEIRTGANGFFIKNIDDATDYMVIKADGKVGIGTTSPARQLFVNGDAGGTTDWYNDSDGRLKKNISPIDGALDKISRLEGVYFEWRDTEHHQDGQRVGLIAQEVAEVVPEVVEKKGEYYSLATAGLVPVLIEAMKELKAENEMLKQRIEVLESVTR